MRSQLALFLTAIAVAAVSACGSYGSPAGPSLSPGLTAPPQPSLPQGPFTVSGVISETIDGAAVGVEGVWVEDSSRHEAVYTAADGSYSIANVEAYQGSIYLYVAKSGYQTVTRSFAPTGSETRLDIQLSRQ